MITYQRERIADLWNEVQPLLEQHWDEISAHKDIPLDPDVARYNAAEAAGWLRAYTAREAKTLIGYAAFMVAPSLHYRASVQAVQDVVYVAPERRGRVGIELLRFANLQLRAEGVQLVYQHQKVAHPALGVVLRRIGYQHVENIWAMRLDQKGD